MLDQELIEYIEDYCNINFTNIKEEIKNELSFSNEEVDDFLEWFIYIKEVIISSSDNGKIPHNYNDYFDKINDGYLGEGCYNITFNYKDLFAVKIPKIELYGIKEINQLHHFTNNFENAYGLFTEYDIKTLSQDKGMAEYLILPIYTNLELMFGIYELGDSINFSKISKNKKYKNYKIFEFLHTLSENQGVCFDNEGNEVDILNYLDYKDDHVLIIDNEIRYCDVNGNVIDGFIHLQNLHTELF